MERWIRGNRPLSTVLKRSASSPKMASTTSMADTNLGKRRQFRACGRIESDLNNSFQAPTAVNGTSRGDFTSDAAVAIHASTAQ